MKIIAGKYKGIVLKTPKGLRTRPTPSRLREALFNTLQHRIEGASLLDLFAGSGLIGFEALSRGAKRVLFVDNHPQSLQTIKRNAESLSLGEQVEIVRSDAIKALERCVKQKRQFSIIYADPPYNQRVDKQEGAPLFSKAVLQYVDKSSLLASDGLLFIEEGHLIDVDEMQLERLTFDRSLRCGQATLHQFSLGRVTPG